MLDVHLYKFIIVKILYSVSCILTSFSNKFRQSQISLTPAYLDLQLAQKAQV